MKIYGVINKILQYTVWHKYKQKIGLLISLLCISQLLRFFLTCSWWHQKKRNHEFTNSRIETAAKWTKLAGQIGSIKIFLTRFKKEQVKTFRGISHSIKASAVCEIKYLFHKAKQIFKINFMPLWTKFFSIQYEI